MSLPIAIVASGNGTNAQAMIDLMKAGVLDVDIRLVFCNRPGARVLQRAEAAGIPSRMLDHAAFPADGKEPVAQGQRVSLRDIGDNVDSVRTGHRISHGYRPAPHFLQRPIAGDGMQPAPF